MHRAREFPVQFRRAQFVVGSSGFEYNVVKPDRQFDRIRRLQQLAAVVEHAQAVVDVFEGMVVTLRLAIAVDDTLVDCSTVVRCSFNHDNRARVPWKRSRPVRSSLAGSGHLR